MAHAAPSTQGTLADALDPAEAPRAHPYYDALERALVTVNVTAAVAAYLAVVSIMTVNYSRARWDLLAGPALLFLASAALLVRPWGYRIRGAVLTASLLLCVFLLDSSADLPQIQLLYASVVLVSGILLGPGAATLTAAAATLGIIAQGTSPPGYLPWNVGLVWFCDGVIWITIGSIVSAIARSEESEGRAWQIARQASERRGELAAARKAVADMYEALQRTNHELAVAREEADEARQIKAQFAANISHELRTPLNLIVGFSEMMYRSPEAYGNVRWTPALRADIHEIYQASRHLSGMIDDILDLSRIESQRLPLRLEPTDLAELINEMVATARGLLRGKDVELRVRLEPNLPTAVVDRIRIGQVLLNLLNNAIRFTDHGFIELSGAVQEGEIVVAVSDTGMGIAPEDMATIFEEFGQARTSTAGDRGGAGLGLAICKQFVHLHGGRIEAESALGKGSTFRFRLPLPESGRGRSRLSYYAPDGWSPPVPENPLGSTVLLLGPPSQATATLARAIQGYRSVPLDDLDQLAARVESEHPAGVVLIRDTDAADVVEAEEVLRRLCRDDLPLVECRMPTEDVAAAVRRKLGVRNYLVKPVQRSVLLTAVRAAVAAPKRVLVVDDDPGFVALVKRILEAEFQDLQVRTAYSAEEALAFLAQECPDLVLVDLIMPDRSGTDVVEAVQLDPALSAVPIIVTTGSNYADTIASTLVGEIRLVKYGNRSYEEWGRYVSALLRVAPPDYSRPVPLAEPPVAASGRPVS